MNKIQLSTTQPQTYFKIYCFNMFLCGLMVSSFGPIIPYLSEYLNRSETQFSFLFVARTVGSLIACFLYKYIRKVQQQTFNDHKILSLCNGIIAIFALLFSQWLSVFGEWVEVIAIGGAYYFVITGVNILILVISNNKRHGWMPFSSGMFGVGALTSPQIIRFFQLDLYLIICFLFLCCSALNYHFPTPNKGGTHEQKKKQLKYKEGTLAQQIVISCSFFLIVGIQMTVSGWIPSYAVLSGISDKAQATIYITIFWAMSTTFRFIASALHTKLSIKIKTLVISILSTSTICIILHQNEAYGIAALFGSAFYGISCSAVYPTLFSLSTQFGIKFRPQQTANMMLSTVLSYGILVAMVGKFMKTNINSLFYSLFGMSLLLCVAVFYVLYLLRRQSDLQIAKETQLEQILVQ